MEEENGGGSRKRTISEVEDGVPEGNAMCLFQSYSLSYIATVIHTKQ